MANQKYPDGQKTRWQLNQPVKIFRLADLKLLNLNQLFYLNLYLKWHKRNNTDVNEPVIQDFQIVLICQELF
jgi:hypothetical protein